MRSVRCCSSAWLVALCVWFDITPARLSRGLSGLFVILRQMIPPSPGAQWQDILRGLAESVAMAFLGTFVAAMLIALPLGFLGARNVVVNALAHFSIRRVFDGFRGVDQLIWALAFVRAVGLGPLAGVLAITAADICVLAKLFAEAIENADRAADRGGDGGRRLAPAGDPLRPAAAGAAGAAGAGALSRSRATRAAPRSWAWSARAASGCRSPSGSRCGYWDEVSFIIILILATVAAIDFVSARIRRRIIGGRGRAA